VTNPSRRPKPAAKGRPASPKGDPCTFARFASLSNPLPRSVICTPYSVIFFGGIDGYCLIPYDYLTNPHLASDFWAIRALVVK